MRVLAISGSLRAGSSNTALLQAAARIAPRTMQFLIYQGFRELPHFDPDLDREQDEPPRQVSALRAEISAAVGEHAQASLVETLRTMSARVLVESSLLAPFLRKKLAPGVDLTEDEARAVKSSLGALAFAAQSG